MCDTSEPSRPLSAGRLTRRQRKTCVSSNCSRRRAGYSRRASTARSCQNHPLPKLLPRQIPIDGQTLIAFPRVPSSEAFGRRLFTGSTARDAPASETLHENGTFAPRPERGRGSNFIGDSAAAEISAREHADFLPGVPPPLVNRC